TILLDEITEMDLKLQAKLLRVLQEKEVEALGSRSPRKIDVRVIATTNRDIVKTVGDGNFREDLYYRLSVFPITIPALRERRDDIAPLVNHLLKKHSRGMDIGVSDEAMEHLTSRHWKGNVRELENVIARACILSNGSVITMSHLDEGRPAQDMAVGSVRDMETKLIIDALKSVRGNRSKAAGILGITVRTLRNKINEYRAMGIDVPAREY
ncbi:MAG TPA: sigma 54-interacting transcriptional regulator, partial [Syntrophorhabdaceae bacterium]|nr:sigma 54-interacting transcriptional regulator [Syntrophorhabdaceae bacterium]